MKLEHGFTVVVTRPAGFDRHGVPKTAGPDHTIGQCARDRKSSAQRGESGELIIRTDELLLCDDPDADVQPGDVLTLPDGSTWQVDGDVDRPQSPLTGWRPGCVVTIVRANGAAKPQD